jgi:hypothetical protein
VAGVPASADEVRAADRTLAQSLFDEGRRLMDAGRFSEACPRFADSQRLDPGGGTLLNLALCYERLGRIGLAYITYGEALSLAIAEHRPEREAFARQRVAAIEGRLPRLRIVVREPALGLAIRLDGTPVPGTAWGIPAPVDPGRHTIDATAPGRAPFQAIVTLGEGQFQDIPVVFSPERSVAPSWSEPTGGQGRHTEWHRPAGFYVLGGLAVAAGITSFVTGLMALSAHNAAQGECNTSRGYCSSDGINDASRARTLAWVSTATLAGGAAAGFAALVLPLSETETATVSFDPRGAVTLSLVR